ncbi:TIGR00341 family protein [Haloarcula amylovorans]|uniref:TIGR00341 family protein n=1 Tax=Haloarcula amylovorans TaxID=2562280 RepID=UPI001076A01E|nr:TIGR00341 family protein [Halomicroarcula amylolytica]
MRLIQIRVVDDHLEAVQTVLDDREIDYVETEEKSNDEEASLFQFPLPPEAVDEVFAELEAAGMDPDRYAVIGSVETSRSNQTATTERHDDRISHDELRGRAIGMNPGSITYYGMTILSAVVATAGLLLDSPAVVVGSMVIAPQVGSALTASVGTALDDRALVKEGFRDQILGLSLAVVSAAAFGMVLRYGGFVPSQLRVGTVQQISQRISPGFLSMAVGICAGAAGAFGLATALPVSLVGVMIAAALIPAAAAVGIGLAWGLPPVALGAGILLVVNAASVNLAGFSVLWGLGFRPWDWPDGEPTLGTARKYVPTVLALAVLLATFAGASTVTARQMQVETSVNDAVEEVLNEAAYERLRLLSVRTQFGGVSIYQLDREVTVEVSRPDGEVYPALAGRLDAAITPAIGQETSVEVTFVNRQTEGA